METVQRLYSYYLSLPQEEVQDIVQENHVWVNPPKKKGRPKK
jgi:predicted RNA-binding protein